LLNIYLDAINYKLKTFNELMNLDGRISLVTGAAGNLGKVICNTLAELGANIVINDLPNKNLDSIKSQIENDWGVKVYIIEADLGSTQSRKNLVDSFSNEFTNLDILINNAAFVGTSNLEGWSTRFLDQSSEIWEKVLEVNLVSAFHLAQEFTPYLNKSNSASIINIASIYGEFGPDWKLYDELNMGNPAAYSVSKAGLIQLTKWLATTLAPNIRVNSISPGGILREQPKKFIDRYSNKTPLQRMCNEDDLCGAIGFLSTNLSQYVTGQNLYVDGGWSIW
jgi:NAD(P)-dependent dehydrogenase (short-subunit alcohol dehydrogenase family)